MDRPVLHAFVDELVDDERLAAFAEALPARARVSDAALPVVLASLYEHLDARSSASCPRTSTRATSPRRPRGSSATTSSPRCRAAASAGSRASSRRRTSSASARGRSTCSRAAGSSAHRRRRRGAAAAARGAPRRCRARRGERAGVDALAESLALAGYERSERVDDRGQFAVRGGLVDVFPTTGREPLRVEFFGDEVESIRAFSPFTQRALAPGRELHDLPGGGAPPRPRRGLARRGG